MHECGESCSSVSVVIPMFNNSAETIRAIESVMRQTVRVHEVLVVDDASSPDVAAEVACWADLVDDSPQVSVVRMPMNVGPGMARFVGAENASGTYVAFLDSDDVWLPQKVEWSLRAMSESDAHLTGHRRGWQHQEVGQTLFDDNLFAWRSVSRAELLVRNAVPTSSILTRTDIAQRMFKYGGRRAEDYMALLFATSEPLRVVVIPQSLAWARKPDFGASGEGSNQFEIYLQSYRNAGTLRREGHLGVGEYALFSVALLLKAPIGLTRLVWYRLRWKSLQRTELRS